MKVLDSHDAGGGKHGLVGRLRATLSDSGGKEGPAEDALIAGLSKVLDNKYVLLRNVPLEGPDVSIPLILIGPPGVRVIYASGAKGVFRAKEDSWEEMDNHSSRFRVARPNLLARTLLMGRAVDAYLTSHGQTVFDVEPVLFFADPGVHVEAVRPMVRIVLSDAVERLASSLLQSRPVLEPEAVNRVVQVLKQETIAESAPASSQEIQDQFTFLDLPPEKPARPERILLVDESEPQALRRVPFNRRQLLILAGLLLVNLILCTLFIVLVLRPV